MKKINTKTIAIITILAVFAVLIINTSLVLWLSYKSVPPKKSEVPVQKENKDYFSYKGKDGKNALTLLKEKTTVEEAGKGFVSSIAGRAADKNKHEYWAFYINGKLASVGASDYSTKDSDAIEWRIEKY